MNEEIRILDLFSGIGGFSLGLEWASPTFQTVAFCERDPFAQRVLRKHWPEVPIYDDVKTIPTDGLGRIDMVTGGFPCQPASVAGARKGREDDRWLWSEIIRIVRGTQPTWLLLENVRGLLTLEGGMVFEDCIADLETAGYESQTFIIPACAVDSAPHRRDRVWIVAHANSQSEPDGSKYGQRLQDVADTDSGDKGRRLRGLACEDATKDRFEKQYKNQAKRLGNCSEDVADTQRIRQQGQGPSRDASDKAQGRQGQATEPVDGGVENLWLSESKFRGVADGLSRRLDESGRHKGWENGEPEGMQRVSIGVKDRANRLKTLGNAVVPQVVEQIGKAILEGWSQVNEVA